MKRSILLAVSDTDMFLPGDELVVGSKGIFRVEARRAGALLIRRLWWRSPVWRAKRWLNS